MRHIEIAGQLYQFSLSTRSEITQSLQLPLLVISVFAAASSTLAPQYHGVHFSALTVLDWLYYGSTILLIGLSCGGLVLTLKTFANGKYVRVIFGQQFDELVNETSSPRADVQEAEGILAARLIRAARENDEINALRAGSRRTAMWLLMSAAGLFFVNITLFVLGSRV